ncbi:endonuclease [Leadbettera azotonutricia]|uniref:Endonuclease/exonuclease/phosphatase family protein n=1 Tax=Leadbettera azotonutricia (strain ATCC BAA-888 / DSM 13862 / ZAS-9) TaxID=545695 RepID=F5YE44_LEAAZ|nr:endonuclease [Leadbettera azotonutricia]AEF81162.1 endonuclease/exonuclease/phosphatase family protein [Leadbettera azotonutricia ZAS-9]
MKLPHLAVLFLGFLGIFPLSCNSAKNTQNTREEERIWDTVKICSFNIQIFGVSKMAKSEVAGMLAQIVSGMDIVAVQEVRSVSIEPVEQFMALLPERYSYVLGPREGRSGSKEQYWVIYDAEKFTLLGAAQYPDHDDVFERNPLGVYLQSPKGFDFILIDNHLQPGGAKKEIEALPAIVSYFRDYWGEEDVLVMGDFNADGSYYNESALEAVFPVEAYEIVITNDFDTTVAASDNTYDRFIITDSAREDFTGNRGVLRFDEEFDFSLYSIKPLDVSDHYPIWAEFYTERDTD